MGKWIAFFVVAAAAVGGGAWYWKSRHNDTTTYQTVPVTRGDVVQAVTATGPLDPVVNVQVGSQISGIVKKLYVDFNSVVKSNQIIAEIDPSTYEVAVAKAEADLANAKANLFLAKVQAERADSLFTNKLISGSDHDTAQAQMQQAAAQVQSDEASLRNTKVQLSYCTIYAPVDGVVISRNVDVGQTVAASFNTPTLFVIANDLTKMQIDALVSEADIGGVATNQDVDFNVDAYPYRTFHGKVTQIRYGAITNQNVINYDCVVDVKNNDLRLLPGMTANVSIITASKTNVLRIPNGALRFRPPDAIAADMLTNNTRLAESAAAASPRAGGEGRSGSGGGGPGAGGGRGGGPGGGGEHGPGAGPPGGATHRGKPERQLVRTVYTLRKASPDQAGSAKPQPVQIKMGISDGINTEVVDGLQEGQDVVTGVLSFDASSRPNSNPFGGGFRRF
ncbi:MAG TPA: efflux RND transporter periplasmic adaptor subunit [Verrucomicrobiae bacterium]|nr:efflux RND transporter periplasmic adaptor subunit [Verrucomicrobiae bacterium]